MHLDSTTIDALAADCRAKRERMEILRASMQAGQASYEEAAQAAKEFCEAFSAYHRAKFGKPKRLDYRYVLRSA